MSRRHRLEQERARLLRHELAEERDKLKLQKERIYAPLVWRKMPCNIRIQDMKPNNYDEVLKLLRDHFYPRSLLSRNVNLAEEEVSVASFEKRLLFSMKDQTSVVAVDEIRNDKIVGVLINHVIHKSNYARVFTRTLPIEGEAYKKLAGLLNYLCRNVDVYDRLSCDHYLRMVEICVHPGYLEYGLEEEFYLVAVDVAMSLKVPVIMGTFATGVQQKFAKKIGLEVLMEVYYTEYRDRMNKMIICDPGAGNYSCVLMAGRVTEVTEAPSQNTIVSDHNEKEEEVKLTRADKRALLQAAANKEAFKTSRK